MARYKNAAGELREAADERVHGLEVQVVGWLVEEEAVRAPAELSGSMSNFTPISSRIQRFSPTSRGYISAESKLIFATK